MAEEVKRWGDGVSMLREELVKELVVTALGGFVGGPMMDIGMEAYDMGVEYAETRRFNNSSKYHSFRYTLEGGERIDASQFYRIFTTRFQTHAYIEAETLLKRYFDDSTERIFHLVRDQRFGINGVFRAVTSQREIQPLSFTQYVMVIACFGAGYEKVCQGK